LRRSSLQAGGGKLGKQIGDELFAPKAEVGLIFTEGSQSDIGFAAIPAVGLIGVVDLGNDEGDLVGGVADDRGVTFADDHVLHMRADDGADAITGQLGIGD